MSATAKGSISRGIEYSDSHMNYIKHDSFSFKKDGPVLDVISCICLTVFGFFCLFENNNAKYKSIEKKKQCFFLFFFLKKKGE